MSHLQLFRAGMAAHRLMTHAGGPVYPAFRNTLNKYATQPAGVAKPLSPAVLAIVNANGLDAAAIPATGPKGHILKGDVLSYMDGTTTAKVAETSKPSADKADKPASGAKTLRPKDAPKYVDIEASNIRKVIARRLTESKSTIPHAYSAVNVNMTNAMHLRKNYIAETGQKFSLNDLIIKAAALALRMSPHVNVVVESDGQVKRLPTVDISVAVATDNGLITPIITEADTRSVPDISATVKELAGRARENKLLPHEYQGGTFSISNLGMFGIKEFSGVINPPQAAILAVGGTRPVLGSDGKLESMATFTLSADARACNDEEAGALLRQFKKILETPGFLF